MIDFIDLQKSIESEDYFLLARAYYKKLIENNNELNDELPEGVALTDIVVSNKSISVLLEHTTIQAPSIEVRLDLLSNDSSVPIGSYQLIIDNKKQFIDEFLIFL